VHQRTVELYLIAIYHCSRNRRNLPSGNNCPFVIDGYSKILPTPVANLSPVLATVDFVADVYRALHWSCIQLHPVRDQSKPLQTCRPTGPFMVTEWVRNRPSNLLVVTGNRQRRDRLLSSSFTTPLAAHNKIGLHTIHIRKMHRNRDKKCYKVTVPAKTLHTASLTHI